MQASARYNRCGLALARPEPCRQRPARFIAQFAAASRETDATDSSYDTGDEKTPSHLSDHSAETDRNRVVTDQLKISNIKLDDKVFT